MNALEQQRELKSAKSWVKASKKSDFMSAERCSEASTEAEPDSEQSPRITKVLAQPLWAKPI